MRLSFRTGSNVLGYGSLTGETAAIRSFSVIGRLLWHRRFIDLRPKSCLDTFSAVVEIGAHNFLRLMIEVGFCLSAHARS